MLNNYAKRPSELRTNKTPSEHLKLFAFSETEYAYPVQLILCRVAHQKIHKKFVQFVDELSKTRHHTEPCKGMSAVEYTKFKQSSHSAAPTNQSAGTIIT
jgi:hypothetical protein